MPVNPLQYIPTLQSPIQGSNLPMILKALQGNGSPPSNPWNQPAATGAGQDEGSGVGPSSTYQGFNYGNNYDPHLSGQDLAAAARTGVSSGLTFDPSTGNVF